jgi:hypothetical protein
MRRCFDRKTMKHMCLLGSVWFAFSFPLIVRAGDGSHQDPGIVPESTVSTTQTSSAKNQLHTGGIEKRGKMNLTTAQTPGVVHNCNKNVHSVRCVKKCVTNTTEKKPTGPPPIRSVRGGTAFPIRDVQAENALLDRIYNPSKEKDHK